MMRQDQLFSGVFGPGSTKNHTVGKGHVNGLLFFVPGIHTGDRLTVKRRGSRGVHVLIGNQELFDFQRLSAIEFGYDSDSAQQLKGLKALLVTKAVITQAEADALETTGGFQGEAVFYVPLGSLYLGPDTELDIQLQLAATRTVDYPVSVYAVSNDVQPDMMYQYDSTLNMEDNHSSVDSVFLLAPLGTKFVDDAGSHLDVSVQLEDQDTATLTDVAGLFAGTSVFDRIEAYSRADIVTVYRRKDAIPASLYLKVSGADAQGLSVLVRRLKLDQQVVSVNTVSQMQDFQRRLEKLERSEPETAKALRHAGQVPKSTDVARVVDTAKATNKADAAKSAVS